MIAARSFLKRFCGDVRGLAAIEFAFVAPIFAMLIIGMINFSMGFNRKLELEQAANRGIEKVMQTTVDSTVSTAIAQEAASAAKVPITKVVVDNWLECNGARQGSYEGVSPAGQRYARYLTVVVTDNFRPVLLGQFAGPNADGSWTLKGDAGIRTQ